MHRLRQVADSGGPLSAEVAAAAQRLGVAERTVWRRLGAPPVSKVSVYRARSAAIAGQSTAMGVPVDPELAAGWAGARQVDLRTLQRAFERELTPAFVAGARRGERARRAKLVYLEREATARNQVWEGDHKCVPLVVLPPRGRAVAPWLTMFIDDATRFITGWAIGLTPHAGTVLTALRMGMLEDPAYGVVHGVPGLLRLDQGLEFAAGSVGTATGALGTETARGCRAITRI